MANELTISGHHACKYAGGEYELYTHQPIFVDFNSEMFDTEEEAEAFHALFPKSAKLYVTKVFSVSWDGYKYQVSGRTVLESNGVNGGVNETGVKRYRSILKNAAKQGVTIVWNTNNAVNGYETQEAFEEALNG